jgi:hypothetical protein
VARRSEADPLCDKNRRAAAVVAESLQWATGCMLANTVLHFTANSIEERTDPAVGNCASPRARRYW